MQYYLSLLQLAEFKRQEIAFLGLRQSMSESNAKLGVSRPGMGCDGMRWDAMGCDGMQSGAWRTWFGSIVKAVCSPLLVTLDPRAFPAEQLDHELMVINFAWPVPFVLPNTLNSLTSRSAF